MYQVKKIGRCVLEKPEFAVLFTLLLLIILFCLAKVSSFHAKSYIEPINK